MPGQQVATPAERATAERERRGRRAFAAGCIALLNGRPERVDDDLVVALGGAHAENVLAGAEGGKGGYWPRVWAARALLHAWDETAAPAIARAAGDESWRVREMAAKVAARHAVGDALGAMSHLAEHDESQRVRAAASRAVILIVERDR